MFAVWVPSVIVSVPPAALPKNVAVVLASITHIGKIERV